MADTDTTDETIKRLIAERDEAQKGWATADQEARSLRFGLFDIENRAENLGFHGIAAMARDLRHGKKPKAEAKLPVKTTVEEVEL